MTRRKAMEEILEVKNVNKKYQNKEGEVLAIKDINLSVNKGEFISIIRTKPDVESQHYYPS
jgi:ABC-type glutathione transport system ATPase component